MSRTVPLSARSLDELTREAQGIVSSISRGLAEMERRSLLKGRTRRLQEILSELRSRTRQEPLWPSEAGR